jgi:hypothetical protein
VNVWILQNLDTGAEQLFEAAGPAMRAAEAMVGNRSPAVCDGGAIVLYGPGDGSTSVMVRRFPRDLAEQTWPNLFDPNAGRQGSHTLHQSPTADSDDYPG